MEAWAVMDTDWVPIILFASFWFFAFFGGTTLILLSRRAPWKTRLRWAAVSLAAPFCVFLIAFANGGKGIENDMAIFFLGALAVFAAIPANWMTYKK